MKAYKKLRNKWDRPFTSILSLWYNVRKGQSQVPKETAAKLAKPTFGWLEQMLLSVFDERSDPSKSLILRGSARNPKEESLG